MAIYTKKGDKGETRLLGGSRVSKDSLKVSCYGTLDEANAALGVASAQITNSEMKGMIKVIQKQLFVAGAELASDEKGKTLLKEKVSAKDIARFEEIIDKYEQKLGPLREFITPGETTASASLHLARAIIRRAERLIVQLNNKEPVRQEVLQYVNRLSDVLFMLARAEVHFSLMEDIKGKVLEKLEALEEKDITLSLELAYKMAQAAEEKAAVIGVPIVFSVVDPAGNVVLLHRMEGALLASLDLAPNKAYTAVALKMATHELVPVIQPGTELYGIQLSNQNKIVTFGGGYPLKSNQQLIGGIGVSGGTVAEDMLIAKEALKIYNNEGGVSPLTIEVQQLEAIVKQIIEEMSMGKGSGNKGNVSGHKGNGLFEDMNEAIEAADMAQKELMKLTLAKREEIIAAIRKVSKENAETFARMAVDESGMGKYEDKVQKNILAAEKTPGIEDLRTEAISGDNGLTLVELSPYGVIGSITPTTNPTETVICNAIGMIAAGNAVVFSPHPTAKNTSLKAIEVINEAIVQAGGPQNLITTVVEPSIEQAGIMMKHKKIRMLVATGGPGVVKSVLSSGKKAIGAGAGNPPAVVDETADLEKAAKDIIAGCSFDYNLPCVAEKEVIVVEAAADCLVSCMKKHGAFHLTDKAQIQQLTELVVDKGHANKKFIGKSVQFILKQLNIDVPEDARVAIMEVEGNHPLVTAELMMPILPVVRVENVDAAIELAVEVEHGFRHTAIMHSKNVENLTKFAKAIQTTIFVKNGPSYAGIGVGGEGYTTFTIAGPTGEGLTSAKDFARRRKCVLVDGLSIR